MIKKILFCLSFSLLGWNCADQVDINANMEKGKAAFKNKEFAQAVKLFEEVVHAQPNHQEAHYFLGYSYSRLACPHGGLLMQMDEKLSMKAIEHLQAVVRIAPQYTGEVIVLDPYAKMTSEWGMLALRSAFSGNPAQAIERMKQGRETGAFTDALLEYNRNMLNSCEENAILLVNGDMDLFPALYLQAVEGYRQDITVVNLPLLNVPWYLKKMKSANPFGLHALPLSMDDARIDELKPIRFEPKEMTIQFQDSVNRTHSYRWTMSPTVDKNIIRVQDQVLLTIIERNHNARPLYFATTVSEENLIGLQKYLSCEGLAMCLNDVRDETATIQRLDKHLHNFTFQSVVGNLCKVNPDACGLLQNYRSIYIRAAQLFRDQGNSQTGKELLDHLFTVLPADIVPYFDEEMETRMKQFQSELTKGI